MNSIQIRLDRKSLPKDRERVLFQVVIDELYGKWCEGIFIEEEDIMSVSKDIWFDLWSEVVRWKSITDNSQSNDNTINEYESVLVTMQELEEWKKKHLQQLIEKFGSNNRIIPPVSYEIGVVIFKV